MSRIVWWKIEGVFLMTDQVRRVGLSEYNATLSLWLETNPGEKVAYWSSPGYEAKVSC